MHSDSSEGYCDHVSPWDERFPDDGIRNAADWDEDDPDDEFFDDDFDEDDDE